MGVWPAGADPTDRAAPLHRVGIVVQEPVC
jgi:hypothetical protein